MAPTPTRETALATMDAAWREHQAFLDSLPRARLTEPGATGPWSVKDVIAHVTAWRSRTIGRLQAAKAGQPAPASPWPAELKEDDEINEWIYVQHRDEPLEAVLAGWQTSFDQMRAAFAALPDELLFDPNVFPMTEGVPLIEALPHSFMNHFSEEHEPALRAWLASIAGNS